MSISWNYEEILSKHNIKLITSIKKNKDKIKIICDKDHIYEISPQDIRIRIKKGRHICKFCEKEIYKSAKLENCRKIALEKGGQILSSKYVNDEIYFEWKCGDKNHTSWFAPASRIFQGAWCRECFRSKISQIFLEKSKYNIEDIILLAESRGGKLISDKYMGVVHNYEWECGYQHRWLATFVNVKKGTWCPYCSSGIYEEICRSHMEQIFAPYKFPKGRPPWLKTSSGSQLELDGFNDELKLSFEHHGMQHYQNISIFKGLSLERRQELDSLKKQLCINNKVILIEIPCLVSLISLCDLKDFIIKQSMAIGVNTTYYKDIIIDWNSCYGNKKIKKLAELKQYAIEKNGLLLSEAYNGTNAPYNWYCNIHNKTWVSSVSSVKNKESWCPDCALDRKRRYLNIEPFEKKYHIKCEDSSYTNHRELLTWRCNTCDVIIKSSIRSIKKRGYGCKSCFLKVKQSKSSIKKVFYKK